MIQERFFCNLTLRALSDNRIGGTASVTYSADDAGTEFQLYDNVVERIAPGAFDDVLRRQPDVVALFNHNEDHVLGRTPLTLQLSADARGLHYEIELPNTTLARDLRVSIERGDIRGSSFAAYVGFAEWSTEGDNEVRLIKRFSGLVDVSPVTYPAYGSTGVGIARSVDRRSLEEEKANFRRLIETQKRIERMRQR